MSAGLIAGATRRQVLMAGAGLVSVALVRPARADVPGMEGAIREFIGEASVRPGRIRLDIPSLVENGNAAPVTLTVESPMTQQDFVKAIALFNEKNPQPNVAVFHLGPRAGHAQVSTRMRLMTSQKITAIAALSDGTFWSDSADVIVTLAACIEG
jgi:sulfur-oxidizing protein SoxY